LLQKPPAFTRVSPIVYVVDANSQLQPAAVSNVTPQLLRMGFEVMALVGCSNITVLRTLFSNPYPFIAEAIAAAEKKGFMGYNIDFEPEDGVTDFDAELYAAFLTTFSDALHAANLTVSVDVATWGPLWDYHLLANTSVDVFITMETYQTANLTFYTDRVINMVQHFGLARTGIGLQPDHHHYNKSHIATVFDVLTQNNIQQIDIWHDSVPFKQLSVWLSYTQQFLAT